MASGTPLIYVDTSVFGGCFDEEFEDESNRFFSLVKIGRIKILVSEIVIAELLKAPQKVRDMLEKFHPSTILPVEINKSALSLRDAYLEEGILTVREINDATHVALATIIKAHAIVSWNMKHIVRADKIRLFNAVNRRLGYDYITITTPREVVFDD